MDPSRDRCVLSRKWTGAGTRDDAARGVGDGGERTRPAVIPHRIHKAPANTTDRAQ